MRAWVVLVLMFALGAAHFGARGADPPGEGSKEGSGAEKKPAPESKAETPSSKAEEAAPKENKDAEAPSKDAAVTEPLKEPEKEKNKGKEKETAAAPVGKEVEKSAEKATKETKAAKEQKVVTANVDSTEKKDVEDFGTAKQEQKDAPQKKDAPPKKDAAADKSEKPGTAEKVPKVDKKTKANTKKTESAKQTTKDGSPAQKKASGKSKSNPLSKCSWTKQEHMFIGEFASGLSRTYELETAKRVCENLKDRCKGVTCTTAEPGASDCTVRKGVPPLGPSPSGEISFVKFCGEDAATTTIDPSKLDLVEEMEAENIVLPDMTLSFPLSARQEEIFYEEVDKEGILIQGGFFAATDGDTEVSEVDFIILDPEKKVIHRKRAAEGLFHFHTGKVGTYQFKVVNGHMMSKVWVTFSFGKATGQGLEQKELNSVEATCDGLDPLLKGIQNENSYLWIRQKTQLNSMAQAKQHTLFFTMVEFGVLIIVSIAQVYYMKSLFSYRRVL